MGGEGQVERAARVAGIDDGVELDPLRQARTGGGAGGAGRARVGRRRPPCHATQLLPRSSPGLACIPGPAPPCAVRAARLAGTLRSAPRTSGSGFTSTRFSSSSTISPACWKSQGQRVSFMPACGAGAERAGGAAPWSCRGRQRGWGGEGSQATGAQGGAQSCHRRRADPARAARTVRLLPAVVALLAAVPAVVEDQRVAILHAGEQPGEALNSWISEWGGAFLWDWRWRLCRRRPACVPPRPAPPPGSPSPPLLPHHEHVVPRGSAHGVGAVVGHEQNVVLQVGGRAGLVLGAVASHSQSAQALSLGKVRRRQRRRQPARASRKPNLEVSMYCMHLASLMQPLSLAEVPLRGRAGGRCCLAGTGRPRERCRPERRPTLPRLPRLPNRPPGPWLTSS